MRRADTRSRLTHLRLHRSSDRLPDARGRRRPYDGIAVAVHATSRARPRIPFSPWMGPGGDVFSVHEHRRRPQVLCIRWALGVVAAPLAPNRGDLGLTAAFREDLSGPIHIRTVGIVDQLDLEFKRQREPPGGWRRLLGSAKVRSSPALLPIRRDAIPPFRSLPLLCAHGRGRPCERADQRSRRRFRDAGPHA